MIGKAYCSKPAGNRKRRAHLLGSRASCAANHSLLLPTAVLGALLQVVFGRLRTPE